MKVEYQSDEGVRETASHTFTSGEGLCSAAVTFLPFLGCCLHGLFVRAWAARRGWKPREAYCREQLRGQAEEACANDPLTALLLGMARGRGKPLEVKDGWTQRIEGGDKAKRRVLLLRNAAEVRR